MRDFINKKFLLLFVLSSAMAFYACKKKEVVPIVKKDPIVSWANPADIIVGTPIGSTQLNATANVPGIFEYTPAAGGMLGIGNSQTLTVDFSPTDFTNYNKANKSVKINVLPKPVVANDVIFNPTLTYGTMTDQNGNVYKTITIGSQVWMAENLRATSYRNGTPINNITANGTWPTQTSSAYSTYNNTSDPSKIKIYGNLYNWFAVTDTRNIAPVGWHVPTESEWKTLTTFLGGETVAGGKLKEIGITHWDTPNTGADNASGFTALPGGSRSGSTGAFANLGHDGNYWSRTANPANTKYAYYLSLVGYEGSAQIGIFLKPTGLSVRLVKDA